MVANSRIDLFIDYSALSIALIIVLIMFDTLVITFIVIISMNFMLTSTQAVPIKQHTSPLAETLCQQLHHQNTDALYDCRPVA